MNKSGANIRHLHGTATPKSRFMVCKDVGHADLGSNPDSTTCQLHDTGQVTPVSELLCHMESRNNNRTDLKRGMVGIIYSIFKCLEHICITNSARII